MKISISIAVLAVLCAAGCKKDPATDPVAEPEAELTVKIIGESEVTVYADELESTLKFEAGEDWTITLQKIPAVRVAEQFDGYGVDWIYEGVYNQKTGMIDLVIKYLPNYTGKDRKANVIITSNTKKDRIVYAIMQRGIAMDGKPLEKKYDVYAPACIDPESGRQGYWKNGAAVYLEKAIVSGLTVAANDVYACGTVREADNNYRGVYWKNGEKTALPKNLKNSFATAIAVTPSPVLNQKPVVYIAGYEDGEDGISRPQYCKDGAVYQLTVPDAYPIPFWNYVEIWPRVSNAHLVDIAVHGSDVHVIGNAERADKFMLQSLAWYWKNGVRTDLLRKDKDQGVQAFDLAVDQRNGDVYIAGFRYANANYYNRGNYSYYYYKEPEAILWTNGVPAKLEDNAMAKSVFIDGDDVYVAVSKWNSGDISAVSYYRNGQKVTAGSAGPYHAVRRNSIAAVDGDVYVMAYGGVSGSAAHISNYGYDNFLSDGGHCNELFSGYCGYNSLMFWKNHSKYDMPAADGIHMLVGDLNIAPYSPTRAW